MSDEESQKETQLHLRDNSSSINSEIKTLNLKENRINDSNSNNKKNQKHNNENEENEQENKENSSDEEGGKKKGKKKGKKRGKKRKKSTKFAPEVEEQENKKSEKTENEEAKNERKHWRQPTKHPAGTVAFNRTGTFRRTVTIKNGGNVTLVVDPNIQMKENTILAKNQAQTANIRYHQRKIKRAVTSKLFAFTNNALEALTECQLVKIKVAYLCGCNFFYYNCLGYDSNNNSHYLFRIKEKSSCITQIINSNFSNPVDMEIFAVTCSDDIVHPKENLIAALGTAKKNWGYACCCPCQMCIGDLSPIMVQLGTEKPIGQINRKKCTGDVFREIIDENGNVKFYLKRPHKCLEAKCDFMFWTCNTECLENCVCCGICTICKSKKENDDDECCDECCMCCKGGCCMKRLIADIVTPDNSKFMGSILKTSRYCQFCCNSPSYDICFPEETDTYSKILIISAVVEIDYNYLFGK